MSGAPCRSHGLRHIFTYAIATVEKSHTPKTFRDVVLEENVVEVAFLAMSVPGVCGMRLECPVLVKKDGGEMLCKTPLELTVIDI